MHGESHGVVACVHQLFQLRRAADAADEVDALARAGVVDAEHGLQKAILEDADIEKVDRARIRGGFPREVIPFAAEIHARVARKRRGFYLGRRDGEDAAHFRQESLGRATVEILHGTVVGQDFQLVAGEEHAEEPVVVLASVVTRIALTAQFAHAEGAGRTVMSVGDIGGRHITREEGLQRHTSARRQFPDLVLHAIRRREVVLRSVRRHVALDDRVDARRAAIGQEDRSCVRAQRVHEAGAVVLFVLAGLLVLFDDVLLVIFRVADAHEPGLTVAADGLAIQIERRSRLTHEHAIRLELEEVLASLRIHLRRVRIDRERQVDLRPVHMQEVQRLVVGERVGFLAVEDIIWHSGDIGGVLGSGNETLERTETHGARMVERCGAVSTCVKAGL